MRNMKKILSFALSLTLLTTSVNIVHATEGNNTTLPTGEITEIVSVNDAISESTSEELKTTIHYLDFNTKEPIADSQNITFNKDFRMSEYVDIEIDGYTSYQVDYSEAAAYLEMAYKEKSRVNEEMEHPYYTIYDIKFGCSTMPTSSVSANIYLYYMPSLDLNVYSVMGEEVTLLETSDYFSGELGTVCIEDYESEYAVSGYYTSLDETLQQFDETGSMYVDMESDIDVYIVYSQESKPHVIVNAKYVDPLGSPLISTADTLLKLTEVGQKQNIPISAVEGFLFYDAYCETASIVIEKPETITEGSSDITVSCTAINDKVTANIILMYAPKDTLTFHQVLDNDYENASEISAVELNSLSGTVSIGDYIEAPMLVGYTFKGFVMDKENIDSFSESVEFTDALTKENANVYLSYESYQEGNYPEGLWVEDVAPQTYTGKAIKPAIQVYDGETPLTLGKDYTVSYKNNTKANDASDAKTAPTITVKGKGNYTGTETVTFQILKKDIAAEEISTKDILLVANNKVQKPVPTLSYNGKKLANKKDFIVSYPAESAEDENAYKAPGAYTIRIDGTGNFEGSRNITLTITASTLISKTKIAAIPKQEYTGAEVEPELKITYKGESLKKGVDYTVSFTDNTEIGKATATITGIGLYAGEKKVTFQIIGKSIAKAKINDVVNKVYSGKPQEQTVSVVLNGQTLNSNTDYEVSYSKNTNAGTAQVIVKGKNNYTGTVKKSFKITPYDLSADTEGMIGEFPNPYYIPYTIGGSKPLPTVTFGETTLVNKKDYTLSYKNNKKVARQETADNPPTIVIKGKGNFKGKLEVPFTIINRGLGKGYYPTTITAPDVVYSPKPGKYKVKPTLYDFDGQKLKAGVHYSKNYRYCTEDWHNLDNNYVPQAGETIVVCVSGIGDYVGSDYVAYRVVQASIKSCKASAEAQVYTGNAITLNPEDVVIKQGKTKLEYGVDYVIVEDSYKNNTNKGTASFVIKGIGNYGGEKKVTFKITSKKFAWFWNLTQ